MRATVGDGTIEIRNEEQQAALENNGTTAPVEDINRDPDKAWEITSEKSVKIDFLAVGYVS